MTVIDSEDGVDGEDGEGSRRTENERNIMEWTGMTGTDGESTANRLERNSRSELYYSISPFGPNPEVRAQDGWV